LEISFRPCEENSGVFYGGFWRNFVAKGRMESLLERVPCYIVLNPQVGLLGARVVCKRLLRKQGVAYVRTELDQFALQPPDSVTPGSFDAVQYVYQFHPECDKSSIYDEATKYKQIQIKNTNNSTNSSANSTGPLHSHVLPTSMHTSTKFPPYPLHFPLPPPPLFPLFAASVFGGVVASICTVATIAFFRKH